MIAMVLTLLLIILTPILLLKILPRNISYINNIANNDPDITVKINNDSSSVNRNNNPNNIANSMNPTSR